MRTPYTKPTIWLLGMALFLLAAPRVLAQQRMQYSQYMNNGFLVNPALAGVEDYTDLKLGYVHQWAGFPGAPRGLFATVNKGFVPKVQGGAVDEVTSLPALGRGRYRPTTRKVDGGVVPSQRLRIGIGGSVYSEQTGPISYSGLTAAFASNLQIKDELRLALGVNLDMMHYQLNTDEIILNNLNDPSVLNARRSLLLPGISVGGAVYSQSFFVAASSRQILRNRITIGPNNPYISRLFAHYQIQAGYRFNVTDDLRLTPTGIIRHVSPAPLSWEIGIRGDYKDLFYFGISHRYKDAFIGLLGFNLNQTVILTYSYDYIISTLGNFNSGSHGITLGFRIPKKVNRERRYFW